MRWRASSIMGTLTLITLAWFDSLTLDGPYFEEDIYVMLPAYQTDQEEIRHAFRARAVWPDWSPGRYTMKCESTPRHLRWRWRPVNRGLCGPAINHVLGITLEERSCATQLNENVAWFIRGRCRVMRFPSPGLSYRGVRTGNAWSAWHQRDRITGPGGQIALRLRTERGT